MPKQLKEIRNFMKGITSNASPTDVHDETATYSLNVNSNNILGRLEGVKKDKVLTSKGFNPLEDISADTITLDFEDILGSYGDGESSTNDAVDDFGIVITHRMSEIYLTDGITTTDSINNFKIYSYEDLAGNETDIASNPQPYNFFDDTGTLQWVLFQEPSGAQVNKGQLLEFGQWQIRDTGSTINGDGFSPRPIYGWNPNLDGAYTKQFFNPLQTIVQIHLAGKEWLFKITDTDFSGTGTAYTCDLSILNPVSLSGAPFLSDLWNVEVVTVEVDLNWNRLSTSENMITTFLNTIKTHLEASGKIDSVVITNQSLEIVPKYKDSYNFARILKAGMDDSGARVLVSLEDSPMLFTSTAFQSIADKTDRSKTDIISIDKQSIKHYSHIFSKFPSSQILNSAFNFIDVDLKADSDKVYIGAGGSQSTPPKIALHVSENSMLGLDEPGMQLEDFNLSTFEEMSQPINSVNIGETIIFPIHGRGAATNADAHQIIYGDNNIHVQTGDWVDDGKTSNLDYDFETGDLGGSVNLYTYIADNNILVGQIIRLIDATSDSADAAFLAWKKYDYDISVTQTDANDLFMYCGEAGHATPYPVLRYIGTQDAALGGTNAFSYTYRKNSSTITKISLTLTSDGDAFTGESAGTIQPTDGTSTAVNINNVGSRSKDIDVLNTITSIGNNTYITALSMCNSPLLYNGLELPGAYTTDESTASAVDPFNYETSDLFRTNGNLKYLARHGVFWLALKGNSNSLYRINLIDFHNLTINGVTSDILNLDYSNIPNRLRNNHTQQDWTDNPNGKGIININIADQEYGPNRDLTDPETAALIEDNTSLGNMSLALNDSPEDHYWTNVPQDAKIIGICETFECGRIVDLNLEPTIHGGESAGYNAFEFKCRPCDTSILSDFSGQNSTENSEDKTSPRWTARLTTGDKVMFIGLDTSSDENRKFNVPNNGPYTVNMVDVNKFIVQSISQEVVPGLSENIESANKTFWWNSKVWILFGKETEDQGFDKWDLFLYNANTLDINSQTKNLQMADRTIPYSEAGYHDSGSDGEFYYPRQFAFMMNHAFSNVHDDIFQHNTDYDATYGGKLQRDNFLPNGYTVSDNVLNKHYTPYASAWGIYDKGGRWTTNGGMQWVNHNYTQTSNQTDKTYHYSAPIPGRGSEINTGNETSNQHFGENDGGWLTNGKLFFGHNIGWDSRQARHIEPVANSIHPLSHYSRNFLAGRIYQGSSGENLETYNLPRHAVSFIGNVTGKFIGQPPTLERHNSSGTGNDTSTSLRPFMSTNQDSHALNPEGTITGTTTSNYYQFPSNQFTDYTIGSTGWAGTYGDMRQSYLYYQNEPTLFQLDEWTGHPGIVYRNFSEGDTPSQTDFGVVRGRPNFGGPEIENPNFKPWVRYGHNRDRHGDEEYAYNIPANNQGTETPNNRHILTNPSNNRGFYEGNEEMDKGWGGYEPPSLFNPGKGYYVFINRTWKTASTRTLINGKNYINNWGELEEFNWSEAHWHYPEGQSPYTHTHFFENDTSAVAWEANGWNFQWYDWPADGMDDYNAGVDTNIRGGRRLEKSANRWNNFSCTAIADASFPSSGGSGYDGAAEGANRRENYEIQAWRHSKSMNEAPNYLETAWTCNKYVARSFVYEEDNENIPSLIGEDGENIQYKVSVVPGTYGYQTEAMDCVFKTGRGQIMGPVCTMHKIDIPFAKINNIFPTILRSKQSTTDVNFIETNNIQETGAPHDGPSDEILSNFSSNQYIPAYLCGIKKDDGDSGLLVLTHDLTPIMAKDAKRYGWYQGYWDYNMDNRDAGFFTSRKRANCYAINTVYDSNARDTNFHNRDSWALETIGITGNLKLWGNRVARVSSADSSILRLRLAALKDYSSLLFSDDLKVWNASNMTPVTQSILPTDGSVSTTAADNLSIYFQVTSTDNSQKYFAYKSNVFDLEKSASAFGTGQNIHLGGNAVLDNGDNIVATPGDTSGYFRSSILDTATDGDILSISKTSIEFEEGPTNINGAIQPGLYKYKFTFEHDNEFEGSMQDFPPYTKEIETACEYLNVKIKLDKEYVENISKRITGLGVYRTIDENTSYGLVDIIKLDIEKWTFNTELLCYIHNIKDRGTKISFTNWNGISEDVENSSKMHYGLSAIFKGYMFITDVWHPDLTDVKRYIYRSLPGNFFKYNWAEEFAIMPEVPIAMTSFNSRLYVWGQNKLYKVDPITMLIEDEYEGISIAGPNAFVKTEFGLCFLDKNNIYLHDGNKPNPIGNPILHSAAFPTDTSGTKIQSGYKELLTQTLNNGDIPNVFFLNAKNSFAINLSNSDNEGRLFLYNILNQRWDLSESPRPIAVNSSSDGTVLITDGTLLYNFASADDLSFSNYARKEWTWNSKDLTFGTDTQDKVFRGLNITGTPSFYDITENTIFSSTASSSNSIRAYINDVQVPLSIENKRYASTVLGDTFVSNDISADDTTLKIQTTDTSDSKQEFIRPGHYIKIDDEIMWVSEVNTSIATTVLTISRALLSTTTASHSTNAIVHIISPRLKIASNKRGKKIKIIAEGQRGYIDSMGVVYKTKSIR